METLNGMTAERSGQPCGQKAGLATKLVILILLIAWRRALSGAGQIADRPGGLDEVTRQVRAQTEINAGLAEDIANSGDAGRIGTSPEKSWIWWSRMSGPLWEGQIIKVKRKKIFMEFGVGSILEGKGDRASQSLARFVLPGGRISPVWCIFRKLRIPYVNDVRHHLQGGSAGQGEGHRH